MSTTVKQARAVRAINAVGGALRVRPSLTPLSLLDAAVKRTGLTDFGSDDFRVGLDRLTTALEEEAGLTTLGRVAARSRLVSLLETRLRLVAARSVLQNESITRPVFVLGLPRTGTTVLYGMLAANPAMRSPASWEVSRPFPAPTGVDQARVAAMDKDLDGFRRLAPGIDQGGDHALCALGQHHQRGLPLRLRLRRRRGGVPVDPPVDPSVIVRVMPTPAIQYTGQWCDDLGDDEVLVLRGALPDCRYLSIQLLTRWMESGDWAHHRVFLTDRQLTLDEEGRFEVRISHREPGQGDWIDTTGLRSFNVAVRSLKAEGTPDVTFSRERL